MSADKKLKRTEKKKKKLLAEYDLAKSNDAVKRPGEFLDAGPTDVKKERIDLSGNVGVKLSDEDFKKLKKELAERKKFLTQLPRFSLQYAGCTATFDTGYKDRIPLLMSDVQHLLVYSLCGNSFTTPPHRWCSVQKNNRLENIVVLVVDGVTSTDFLDYEHVFTKLTGTFPHRLEVTAPAHYGSSTAEEFSSFPVSASLKNQLLQKFGSIEAALDSGQIMKSFRALFPITSGEKDPPNSSVDHTKSSQIGLDVSVRPVLPASDMFPRTHLLLSTHQMMMENFPLPFAYHDALRDYELTKSSYEEAHASSPMFAIDCEMCLTTTQKLELTHVAVVNEKHEVVYEELVKPHNRIINYLTKYSGITEARLRDVTKRLEDVQKDLQEILPPDAILVGHSLNSDLQALKLAHPYIIDTSVIYNLTGDRQRKSKLSMLTEMFVGETIQTSTSGHSPSEDAVAALKLVQLKLSKGFKFGDSITDDGSPSIANCQLTSSIFNNSYKAEKTVGIIGAEEVLAQYKRFQVLEEVDSSCYKTISIKQPLDAILGMEQSALTQNFSLAHIDLSAKVSKCQTVESREKLFRKLDGWCERVFNSVSLNGLGVVVFGGPITPSAKESGYRTQSQSQSKNPRNSSVKVSIGSHSVSEVKLSWNKNTNVNKKITFPQTTEDEEATVNKCTDSNSNGSGSAMEMDMKSKSDEIKKELSEVERRRQNGAAFVRIKSAK